MNRPYFQQIFDPPRIDNSKTDPERKVYGYVPTAISREEENIHYPVTLIIQPQAIRFYITGRLQEGANTYFGAPCILDLPISTSQTDALRQAVIVIADTHKRKNNRNLLSIAVAKNEELIYNIPSETIPDSFSVFFNKQTNNLQQKPAKLSRAVLFLDFLFAFFHQGVFDSHPCHAEIKEKISTHPLINAILAKYDFFYYRKLIQEELEITKKKTKEFEQKQQEQQSNSITEKLNLFNTKRTGWQNKQYEQAREKWIDLIIKDNDENLTTEIHWFDNNEEEMSEVLEGSISAPVGILDRAQISNISLWFFNRFGYLKGLGMLFYNQYIKFWLPFKKSIKSWSSFKQFISSWFTFPKRKAWYATACALVTTLILAFTLLYFVVECTSKMDYAFLGLAFILVFTFIFQLIKRPLGIGFIGAKHVIAMAKLPLIVGSIATWSFILGNDISWNLDMRFWNGPHMILVVLLCILLMLFIYNKISPHLKDHTSDSIMLRRTLESTALCIILSGVIGIVMTSQLTEESLKKQGFMTNYFKEFDCNDFITRMDSDSLIKNFNLHQCLTIVDSTRQIKCDATCWKQQHGLAEYKDTVMIQPLDTEKWEVHYTADKNNLDEMYYDKYLPSLMVKGGSCKVFKNYKHFLKKNPESQKKEYLFEITLLPQMLFFYSFVAAVFGMIFELGYRQFNEE